MKWNRDRNGGCDYIMVGNTKYYIIDELLPDGTVSAYLHIEKRQVIEPNKKKYQSLMVMAKDLFGLVTENEADAKWKMTFKTLWSGYDSDVRKFDQDGRHYAINLKEKTKWEFSIGETISPDFRTVEEAKSWADRNLKFQEGLF
jgi:hypothetical protein